MRTSTFRVNFHWIQTFRVYFLSGGQGTGDRGLGTGDQGPGTVGTSRGKRHSIEHIGIHWKHTFRVDFFWWDRGPGQGTRDRGQWERHSIEHIGIHWTHTFRVIFLGGIGDRGPGTRDRGQWQQVEVRDTTSNTLDSMGHRPLGLYNSFWGRTGDRGLGTGKRIQHFMIFSCQHSGVRGAKT